jgi:lipopolysaccharide export system protein LptA
MWTSYFVTAPRPRLGARPDLIIAETNVVIKATDEKGNVIHATGERAVYTYKVENSATNELVELTGNPRVERQGLVTTGEKIIWNRITDDISVTQPHMTIQQDIKSAGTNAPAKGNP